MWNFASSHPNLSTLIVLGFPLAVGLGAAFIIQNAVALRKAAPPNIFDSMKAIMDRTKKDGE